VKERGHWEDAGVSDRILDIDIRKMILGCGLDSADARPRLVADSCEYGKKILVLQNDGEFLGYLSVLQVDQNKTEPTFRWGHF
jgi:hypothetical protein